MKTNWQLYSDHAGVDQASKELTEVLEQAYRDDVSPKTAYKRWCAVASKWRSLGALDTEPRCVALDIIEDMHGMDRNSFTP